MPAEDKALRTSSAKRVRVRGRPSSNRNNGPGFLPLAHRKSSRATTGQSPEYVRPTNRLMPFRNGFVLDCLIVTRSKVGFFVSSTATSPTPRCTAGSKAPSVGTVSSPALRKAKKHRHAAAHSIFLLWLPPAGSQIAFIFNKMGGVIGRRGRCPTFNSTSCFTPLVMYSRRAIGVPLKGSGIAASICMCRMADRYTFMVRNFRPSSASCDTKAHKCFSHTGSGVMAAWVVG